MLGTRCAVCLVPALLLCFCGLATAGPLDPVPVGSLVGWPPYAIAVQGDYAYCVAHDVRNYDNNAQQPWTATFEIFDISDPTNPRLAGFLRLPHRVQGVAVAGNYAYLAAGVNGLAVIDVSDPAAPTELTAWEGSEFVFSVTVSGDHVFVSAGPDGLRILSIADPTAPTEVGVFPATGGAPSEVAVRDSYAYVTTTDSLLVVNVSEPSCPALAGTVPGVGGSDLALWGDRAYVADPGIEVVDISDPTLPQYVGSFFDYDVRARDIVVAGDRAYVACREQGIGVVDVSGPTPEDWSAEAYDTPGHAEAVALSDPYVYVADYEGGLRVFDVSVPELPQEVGRHGAPAFAHDITLSDGLAGVAAWHGYGMQIFDVSDPARPRYLGGNHSGNFGTQVAISGDCAFATSCGTEPVFGVYDICDPSNPEMLWYIGATTAQSLAIRDTYAYVPANGKLSVWDVSHPNAPVKKGSCQLPTEAQDIAVARDTAYIAAGCDGLVVVDVADPRRPAQLAARDTPDWATSVALSGTHCFLADGSTLRILDLSQPSAPMEVAVFEPEAGMIEDIAILGSYLYATDRYYGLRVIGISDPLNPVEAGGVAIPEGAGAEYSTPVGTCGVAARGNHVYVTVFGWGILVFETDSTFDDVPPDHWAADSVERCFHSNVVAGYGHATYGPTLAVDRAQMAVYIARALAGGDANVPEAEAGPSFPDVPRNHWAYCYVEYAVGNDIVAGYDDGRYHPDEVVDRAQMAVYVARAQGWVALDDDLAGAPELFPDVPAGNWAGTAIQACVQNCVVQGYDDGLYRPDAAVTRDQMAVYVARAFDLTM